MSGKSTYIKQVALLLVMAHVGSYVPAKFFSSPCIGRIYARWAARPRYSCTYHGGAQRPKPPPVNQFIVH